MVWSKTYPKTRQPCLRLGFCVEVFISTLIVRYGFQIVLENTSASQEEGDYTLGLQLDANTDGLRVYVSGQALSSTLSFGGFPFGGAKVVVEVFRGPYIYDYSNNPITLVWASACDGSISSTINLTPSYLKPCAKVEFHSSLKTFAVSPTTYGLRKGIEFIS